MTFLYKPLMTMKELPITPLKIPTIPETIPAAPIVPVPAAAIARAAAMVPVPAAAPHLTLAPPEKMQAVPWTIQHQIHPENRIPLQEPTQKIRFHFSMCLTAAGTMTA